MRANAISGDAFPKVDAWSKWSASTRRPLTKERPQRRLAGAQMIEAAEALLGNA